MKARAFLFAALLAVPAGRAVAAEPVYVDPAGVIRWSADQREVALFGANYCLPSATDFRAAGYVGADRKKLVEQDMTHFARMGWDAMRLCLWGDWENSDEKGNLLVNEHLDVMDYAIAEAKKRGVHILLTPITTYAAWWPDAKESDPYAGFSKRFEKSALGTNPAAIAAQCNYLRQILNQVNPYTGVALKDEPAILFVEMINEPWHHPEDFGGSVAYINALAEAVRSTGCTKTLFHNLSQDFAMTAAIKASSVQGVTFAWYPTGLNAGHALTENHLRSVDEFEPMQRADLLDVPKIVYEFDSPDMNSGYMYPAMARAFRGVGAQFATMFSYDMLATAPYNLGWQTHFLNLVYSPKKAVSAIIAAEVMRGVPRNSHYGDYPDNRRFGPFRVNYEEDSSEMVTEGKLIYANGTRTTPPNPGKLRQIVGTGSSSVVTYEGSGAYFLDQLSPGIWRLEVYPDAVIVQDPFAQYQNFKTVSSRLIWRQWPMTIRLPDLEGDYSVAGLNDGNKTGTQAQAGSFPVSPGVYLLSHDPKPDRTKLPGRIGRIGLTEFVCPPAPVLSAQVLPAVRAVYPVDQPAVLMVDVVDSVSPSAVTLHWRVAGETVFHPVELVRQQGYRYAVALPAGALPVGVIECYFQSESPAGKIRFPTGTDALLTTRVVAPGAPLPLFDAARDIHALVYTRVGDTVRHGVFKTMPATATDPAALRLMFPLSMDRSLDDYTASLAVKDRITDRRLNLGRARALRVKARSAAAGQALYLTLVEADGTAWSRKLSLAPSWRDGDIPLADLEIAQGVLLPLGYPGRWDYWSSPAKGRGGAGDRPHLAEIEHIQISLRPTPPAAAPKPGVAEADAWVDVAAITLVVE
jgi:hypothetical protein